MIHAIIGMGRSGEAARRQLLQIGIPESDVLTFDDRPGKAAFSNPAALMARKPAVLVVSPGFPLSTPWLALAERQGLQITSEISLAAADLTDEIVIGVTGSVGKSTTVALLWEGAKALDANAFIGGNFGIPLCEYTVARRLGGRPKARFLVIELSSFQLENCKGLHPTVGAITSFTDNHLERYENKDHYYATKWNLVNLCRGPVFLNARGGELLSYANIHPGNWIAVDRDAQAFENLGLQESFLLGDHNQDNMALAIRLGQEVGFDSISINAMKRFSGLPHRLENLGVVNGIRFVNDSKATALDSVRIAVDSCLQSSSGRVHHLIGGKDKNLPWPVLKDFSTHARLLPIFFGQCGAWAKEKTELKGPVFPTLGEAIDEALRRATPGDTVLLSPGGTSLDEFKNFEERGDFFKNRVLGINPSGSSKP